VQGADYWKRHGNPPTFPVVPLCGSFQIDLPLVLDLGIQIWKALQRLTAPSKSSCNRTFSQSQVLTLRKLSIQLVIAIESGFTSMQNTFVQVKQPLTHASYRSHHLISLASAQNITELLQRTSDKLRLLPQIGSQVSVCVSDSNEGSLQGVLECLGRTGGGCVDIVDTSKLEKTLDGRGCDESSTTGSWDKLRRSVICK
jgi:hypothetical protein